MVNINFDCKSVLSECINFKVLINEEMIANVDIFLIPLAMGLVTRGIGLGVDEPGMNGNYYVNSLFVNKYGLCAQNAPYFFARYDEMFNIMGTYAEFVEGNEDGKGIYESFIEENTIECNWFAITFLCVVFAIFVIFFALFCTFFYFFDLFVACAE